MIIFTESFLGTISENSLIEWDAKCVTETVEVKFEAGLKAYYIERWWTSYAEAFSLTLANRKCDGACPDIAKVIPGAVCLFEDTKKTSKKQKMVIDLRNLDDKLMPFLPVSIQSTDSVKGLVCPICNFTSSTGQYVPDKKINQCYEGDFVDPDSSVDCGDDLHTKFCAMNYNYTWVERDGQRTHECEIGRGCCELFTFFFPSSFLSVLLS